MRFYLGTHETGWLAHAAVPLFVSRRRLDRLRTLPRAVTPWALDSGGFSELSLYGKWTLSPAEYADRVRRYRDEIGMLEWAAPMDWMCEPSMLDKTGLSVEEHQRLTVENYLELRELAPDLPWIPVLQGWTLDDYLRHVEQYWATGLRLSAELVVGVGTICRRQHTAEAGRILGRLAELGLRLHGFGLKTKGLEIAGDVLVSADSLAWSFQARQKRLRLEGCRHRCCSSCLRWALMWRARVLRSLEVSRQIALDW